MLGAPRRLAEMFEGLGRFETEFQNFSNFRVGRIEVMGIWLGRSRIVPFFLGDGLVAGCNLVEICTGQTCEIL